MREKISNWSRVITTAETTNVDARLRAYYRVKKRTASGVIIDLDICSSTTAPGVSTPNYWSSNGMWVKFNGKSRKLNPYVRTHRYTQYASTQSTSRKVNYDYWQKGITLNINPSDTKVSISVGLSNYLWAEGNYTFVPIELEVPIGYSNNKVSGPPEITGSYWKENSFSVIWKPFIKGINNSIVSYSADIYSSMDNVNWAKIGSYNAGLKTSYQFSLGSRERGEYFKVKVTGKDKYGNLITSQYSNAIRKNLELPAPGFINQLADVVGSRLELTLSNVTDPSGGTVLYGYDIKDENQNYLYRSDWFNSPSISVNLSAYLGRYIIIVPKSSNRYMVSTGVGKQVLVADSYNVFSLEPENTVVDYNTDFILPPSNLDNSQAAKFRFKEYITILYSINDDSFVVLTEVERKLGDYTIIKNLFDRTVGSEGQLNAYFNSTVKLSIRLNYSLESFGAQTSFQEFSYFIPSISNIVLSNPTTEMFTLAGQVVPEKELKVTVDGTGLTSKFLREDINIRNVSGEKNNVSAKEIVKSNTTLEKILDISKLLENKTYEVLIGYYLQTKAQSYPLWNEQTIPWDYNIDEETKIIVPKIIPPEIIISSENRLSQKRFNLKLPMDHAYFLLFFGIENSQGTLLEVVNPLGEEKIIYDLVNFSYDFSYQFELKEQQDNNYYIDDLKLFFDEQQVIPTEINNLTGPTTSQKVLNNMEDTYSFIFQFAEVFSSSPTETILDKNLTVELSKQKKIVLIDTRRMPVFPQDAYVEIF